VTTGLLIAGVCMVVLVAGPLLIAILGRFCSTNTRVESAEQRAREVELDAWIDETLRSGS